MKAQAERNGHGSETEREAPPQAPHAKVEREGKEPAANEADRPIADHAEEQRHARILEAAQRTGGDHLGSVEDLEERGDEEEAERESHRFRAGRIGAVE